MKICIKNINYNSCKPATKEEFRMKKEYDRIMNIYKETGKCPYCGSSVEDLGNKTYKEKNFGDGVTSIGEMDKEFMRFLESKKPIQNKVVDAGWANHLKCEACNFMPPLKLKEAGSGKYK